MKVSESNLQKRLQNGLLSSNFYKHFTNKVDFYKKNTNNTNCSQKYKCYKHYDIDIDIVIDI